MIASGVVGIIFTGFSARLIELQVVKHEGTPNSPRKNIPSG